MSRPHRRRIQEQVRQLRICLAHHSYIYYELGSSVVSDATWQSWSDELMHFQSRYGNEFDPLYDKYFKDWDGTTGMHLCSIPGLRQSVKRTHPELL